MLYSAPSDLQVETGWAAASKGVFPLWLRIETLAPWFGRNQPSPALRWDLLEDLAALAPRAHNRGRIVRQKPLEESSPADCGRALGPAPIAWAGRAAPRCEDKQSSGTLMDPCALSKRTASMPASQAVHPQASHQTPSSCRSTLSKNSAKRVVSKEWMSTGRHGVAGGGNCHPYSTCSPNCYSRQKSGTSPQVSVPSRIRSFTSRTKAPFRSSCFARSADHA